MDASLLEKATDTLIRRVDREIERLGSFDPIETGAMKNILASAGITYWTIVSAYGSRLDSQDRTMLQRRLYKIAGAFDNTASNKFYGSFEAVRTYNESEALENALKSAMGDIVGTRLMFLSDTYTSSSYLDLFFDNIGNVIRRCSREISENKNADLCTYVLCSTVATLDIAPSKDYPSAPAESIRCQKILADLDVEKIGSPSLRSFLITTLLQHRTTAERRNGLQKELSKIADASPRSFKPNERSWICANLWELKDPRFIKFGENLEIHSSFPAHSLSAFVRGGHCYAASKQEEEVHLGIELDGAVIDPEMVIKKLFPNYGKDNAEVTHAELSGLFGWDDQQIRNALAKIINDNKLLDDVTRQKALTEAKKPHMSSEFSDMDIPLRMGGLGITASFIVKSGQEIKAPRVDEKWWYQIGRPLEYMDHACSIFISAKPCSTPLSNRFKLARERNQAVRVIDGEELVRFFRSHDVSIQGDPGL